MKVLAIVCLAFCLSVSSFGDEYHGRDVRTRLKTDKIEKASPLVAPVAPVVNVLESSQAFWNDQAGNYIKSKLSSNTNTKKAKNIIFFIGDGMSIPTVAATRAYIGKEEAELSFEKFPHYGLAKTYCIDEQVPGNYSSRFTFSTLKFIRFEQIRHALQQRTSLESRQTIEHSA